MTPIIAVLLTVVLMGGLSVAEDARLSKCPANGSDHAEAVYCANGRFDILEDPENSPFCPERYNQMNEALRPGEELGWGPTKNEMCTFASVPGFKGLIKVNCQSFSNQEADQIMRCL